MNTKRVYTKWLGQIETSTGTLPSEYFFGMSKQFSNVDCVHPYTRLETYTTWRFPATRMRRDTESKGKLAIGWTASHTRPSILTPEQDIGEDLFSETLVTEGRPSGE